MKSDGQRPADYMNNQHLDFFRQRLLALKDEITRNALEAVGELREAAAPSDEADRATLDEEHALALRVRNREDNSGEDRGSSPARRGWQLPLLRGDEWAYRPSPAARAPDGNPVHRGAGATRETAEAVLRLGVCWQLGAQSAQTLPFPPNRPVLSVICGAPVGSMLNSLRRPIPAVASVAQ